MNALRYHFYNMLTHTRINIIIPSLEILVLTVPNSSSPTIAMRLNQKENFAMLVSNEFQYAELMYRILINLSKSKS